MTRMGARSHHSSGSRIVRMNRRVLRSTDASAAAFDDGLDKRKAL